MKDQTYGFFQQNSMTSKYSIHSDLSKNKDGQTFMKIFGKLIANSILEKNVIGIDFSISFLKSLFDVPHVFEDLRDEFDDITYKNYENMKNMSENDLISLEQTFSVYHHGKEHDLIENGANILVIFL